MFHLAFTESNQWARRNFPQPNLGCWHQLNFNHGIYHTKSRGQGQVIRKLPYQFQQKCGNMDLSTIKAVQNRVENMKKKRDQVSICQLQRYWSQSDWKLGNLTLPLVPKSSLKNMDNYWQNKRKNLRKWDVNLHIFIITVFKKIWLSTAVLLKVI